MGETKLQQFVFTLMMCFFMVLGMTTYNLFLAIGPSSHFFLILFKDFWLGFFIALFLDIFIVTKAAKGLAFSIIEKKNVSKLFIKVLLISSFMVTGMVLFMSFYGSVKAVGFTLEIPGVYPRIVLMNFIVALPLNLIVVNPLVRILHSSIYPVRQTAS